MPVMRPMWVEFPTDRSTFANEDHLFVGSALLVRPVMHSSVAVVEAYLPGVNQVFQHFHFFVISAAAKIND